MEMTPVTTRRWAADEVHSRRAGPPCPPLLLGTTSITQTLIDIDRLEPVSLRGLPDAAVHRHWNTQCMIHSLVGSGIVTKFSRNGLFGAGARTALVINRSYPVYLELHNLLQAINLDQLRKLHQTPDLHGMSRYPDVAKVDLRTLFGTPRRTLVIVLAHVRPNIRLGTIAKCIGTNPEQPVKVVEPLLRDGIVRLTRSHGDPESRAKGGLRYVTLAPARWSQALEALLDQLVRLEPHFMRKALIADTLETGSASVMYRRVLTAEASADRA